MLEELTDRVRAMIDGRDAVGFDVKFDLGSTGVIFVSGNQAPMLVSNDDKVADTTFRLSAEDLASMLDGDIAPTMAYVQGRLTIDGDLSQAMKLSSFFA